MKTPYQVVAELGLKPNLLGWKNSTSPVLAEFAAGAKTIVEVGSLLGASVAWMAKNNPEAMFYCIDTWIDPGFPVAGPIQRDRFGAQMLYEQFLTNILADEGRRLGAHGDARRMLLAQLAVQHRLAPRAPLDGDAGSAREDALAAALLDEQPVASARVEQLLAL